MYILDAIREIMNNAGIGKREMGRLMHKSDMYMNGIINRGSIPKVDTMVSIASTCGYDVVLVPKNGGDSITLEIDESA